MAHCGLPSQDKAFNIGRTWNQAIDHISSHTGGRHLFFVDSNMHIGLDYWSRQVAQNVKLDVFGKLRAEGMYYLSDRRYKCEIEPISNLDNLLKINAIQYKPSGEAFAEQLEILKKSGTLSESDLAVAEASTKATIEARNSDNTLHYGFIAQELREIYPELVYEDGNGYLIVNYTELIPVLVDAVKTQPNQINELKSEIDKLKGDDFVKSNTTSPSTKVFAESKYAENSPRLYQNNPNSFDTQTEIKYYISSVAVNATLCIYDLTGSQILKMDIVDRGNGSITIDANQLRAGSRGLSYTQPLFASAVVYNATDMILTGK